MATGMPDEVSAELEAALDRGFPHRLRVDDGSDPGQAVWLDCGVHKVSILADEVPEYREIVGWLRIRDRRVGMIKLCDWSAPPWVSDRQFLDALDGWSREAADFAWALLSAWPVRSVMEQGGVLELTRFWLAAEFARRSLWALALTKLIRRRYASKRALLLIDAYPMHRRVDRLNLDLPWHEALYQRRRRALVRLIARELGTRPLPKGCPPNDFGQEEMWQWLPLRPDAIKPRRRRLRWT